MENGIIPDLDDVKKLTTTNIGEDIKAWVQAKPGRSRELFAGLAGVSLRTLNAIINYDGTGKEPNWRRETKEGIMKALECETYYTPKHEIK